MRRRWRQCGGNTALRPLQQFGDGLFAWRTIQCGSHRCAQAQAVQEQGENGLVQARTVAETQQQFTTGVHVFQQRTAFQYR